MAEAVKGVRAIGKTSVAGVGFFEKRAASGMVGRTSSVSDVVPNKSVFFEAEREALRYEKYWDDLASVPSSLNNRSVRAWYLSKEMEIPQLLDKSKSLEYQAKQAFELRNSFRSKARDLMSDTTALQKISKQDPNLGWNQTVAKYSQKHSGDELWQAIIDASQRSRSRVDQQFNFIGSR